jgi:hypothetical protein
MTSELATAGVREAVEPRNAKLAVVEPRRVRVVAFVRMLLVALAESNARAHAAELEVEQLRARIAELETWLDERAQFDDVEHVQIGRVLAAAEARRIERLAQPLVSIRTLLLLLYSAALVLLALLVLFDRVL